MQAVAYLRVSSRHQADSGLGLDAQMATINAWAASTGTNILTVAVDAGVSGSTPAAKRAGFRQAIAALRENKADALVVAKRCRLSRGDPLTTAMLESQVERTGARVLSVDGIGNADDASATLLKRVIDAVHEHHRLAIGEHTAAALAAKRARGEYCGGRAPYGWRYDGRGLVPVPAEQDTIKQARNLRKSGWTLRAIGDELLRQGRRPRQAAKWSAKVVSSIVSRRSESE